MLCLHQDGNSASISVLLSSFIVLKAHRWRISLVLKTRLKFLIVKNLPTGFYSELTCMSESKHLNQLYDWLKIGGKFFVSPCPVPHLQLWMHTRLQWINYNFNHKLPSLTTSTVIRNIMNIIVSSHCLKYLFSNIYRHKNSSAYFFLSLKVMHIHYFNIFLKKLNKYSVTISQIQIRRLS